MTRQELINLLVSKERRSINYTVAQVLTKIASMTAAEKQALADAINTSDKSIIGNIVDTFFDKEKRADALAAVKSKIVNDRINIDDIADALDDNPRNNQKT